MPCFLLHRWVLCYRSWAWAPTTTSLWRRPDPTDIPWLVRNGEAETPFGKSQPNMFWQIEWEFNHIWLYRYIYIYEYITLAFCFSTCRGLYILCQRDLRLLLLVSYDPASFTDPETRQTNWARGEIPTQKLPVCRVKHSCAKAMFAHLQAAHLDNIVYLSPQDERNHWLQAAILTLGFSFFSFSGI